MFRNEIKCKLCQNYSECVGTWMHDDCKSPLQNEIKTLDNWNGSFDKYVEKGDEIDEKLYNYFLDILPPFSLKSNGITYAGFQVSEAHSDAIDEDGKCRTLYSTFGNIGDRYYYLGLNFKGEVNSKY